MWRLGENKQSAETRSDRKIQPSIAVFVNSFPTLSETFVLDQVSSLVGAGFSVHVFARERDRSGLRHSIGRALASKARFVQDSLLVKVSNRSLLPPWASRLFRAFAERRSERAALASMSLAICHFGPNGIRAVNASHRLRPEVPVWTFFHGYDVSAYLREHGDDVYADLFARGERFFAISELWAEKLRAIGCPADRLSVVRMGVDCTSIPFSPVPIVAAEPVQILSVGRLVEKKGLEYAIRALAQLRKSQPDVAFQFYIAGQGPLLDSLRELTRSLGIDSHVIFLGGVGAEEVKARLARSHIFILPSVTASNGDMEGIPVALMEAMAAGVSVVSTFHSGIPELIGNGVSGLLAPERDWLSLAQHLSLLISDPDLRSAMAAAARAQVEQDFNQATVEESFLSAVRHRLTERRS